MDASRPEDLSLVHVRTQLAAMLHCDVTLDVPAQPERTRGEFCNFVSPSLSVLGVRGSALAVRKGASRTASVHVLQLTRGSVQLADASGLTTLEAGEFVLTRGAGAGEFRHHGDIELLAMYLPAAAVERWLPDWRAVELVKVANHQAEGRLAFDIARDLLDAGSPLQPDAVELVGDTVARLLARSFSLSSLRAAAAPNELADAARRRVRQFCRTHLGSLDLTVEQIARGTGLSRASLHRLFRDQPHTLMEWVQRERLEACRVLIDARSQPQRTLTEIALSQGFKTPAHFSAAFRQRYGLSPRAYRAQRAPAIETLAQKRETQE